MINIGHRIRECAKYYSNVKNTEFACSCQFPIALMFVIIRIILLIFGIFLFKYGIFPFLKKIKNTIKTKSDDKIRFHFRSNQLSGHHFAM